MMAFAVSMDFARSVRIGEDPWQEEFKINAAQASHLGRIARECDANRFHRIKRRMVNSEDRTPERAHVR
jgi:hypothetical protein